MSWLVATGNAHKLREIGEVLGTFGISLVSPAEVGHRLDVEEWGATFAENAVIKATAWADATGRVCLADDSGLEVRALDWGPGVHSARFAGPACDDEANNAKLLRSLADVEGGGRDARYRCVIAVAWPLALAPAGAVGRTARSIPGFGAEDEGRLEGSWARTFDGSCAGAIGRDARGSGGFGYDPYFELPGGRHMAELGADEKHAISHRGVALRRLAAWLEDQRTLG